MMAAHALLGNLSISGLAPMLAVGGWGDSYIGQFSIAITLGLAALGSVMGIGTAGKAAAGAWAKEAKAGKGLSFTYIILLGMPISQTLYAMIVMNNMAGLLEKPELLMGNTGLLLGLGLATGFSEMASAWMQGIVGAAGIRALSEGEGKGFAFLIIALGVVETVGIFAMVFLLGLVPSAA